MWIRAFSAPPGKGFTLVEILLVLVLVSGAVVFLLDVIPNGLSVFVQSSRSHHLYYFSQEKLAHIKAQQIWIQNVDTQNPRYANRASDPANQWRFQLDQDDRNFSNQVRGQVVVTLLRENYLPFGFWDYFFTPRERFGVMVRVSQDNSVSEVSTIQTLVPKKETILGILAMIYQALTLYVEVTGDYPPANRLDLLVPNYLPFLVNDPYTTAFPLVITGYEERNDYMFGGDDVDGYQLYARSHPPNEYPDMVMRWEQDH